jgi:anti-sigma regulatory factor (Ser/Thr protein kinase)
MLSAARADSKSRDAGRRNSPPPTRNGARLRGCRRVLIVPADGGVESTGPGRLSCVWPAVAASVAEARAAVSEFAEAAGATSDALAAVSLAVSEAVTNAVLHAYLDRDEPGSVEVRARREAETVVVEVADEGRGMLPRTDSPGLGLGLPLIAQMTESLEVHDRDGGGTEIRMAFALAATA